MFNDDEEEQSWKKENGFFFFFFGFSDWVTDAKSASAASPHTSDIYFILFYYYSFSLFVEKESTYSIKKGGKI
jgi:hypothetical protein